MGGVMSGKCRAGRRMLRGTSLLEAVVASVVFLTIFTLTISILPQLIVRGDVWKKPLADTKRAYGPVASMSSGTSGER